MALITALYPWPLIHGPLPVAIPWPSVLAPPLALPLSPSPGKFELPPLTNPWPSFTALYPWPSPGPLSWPSSWPSILAPPWPYPSLLPPGSSSSLLPHGKFEPPPTWPSCARRQPSLAPLRPSLGLSHGPHSWPSFLALILGPHSWPSTLWPSTPGPTSLRVILSWPTRHLADC